MDKQTFPANEIGKQVYILNCHIHLLKQQEAQAEQDKKIDMRTKIKELNELKTKVLLKMVRDGHAQIKTIQMMKDKGVFYIVRVSREHSFHMPATKEAKRLLRKIYG